MCSYYKYCWRVAWNSPYPGYFQGPKVQSGNETRFAIDVHITVALFPGLPAMQFLFTYSMQKQKEKCQKLYVSGLQLASFPGSCMGHGSLGMRLVNSLFRFCSKHHNVDNPIQCLYASEIRYVYWLKKAGWLSQIDLEIRPREGCQDFCEPVVCISELANWQCWVPVCQMSSKMVAECLWVRLTEVHISLFFLVVANSEKTFPATCSFLQL